MGLGIKSKLDTRSTKISRIELSERFRSPPKADSSLALRTQNLPIKFERKTELLYPVFSSNPF